MDFVQEELGYRCLASELNSFPVDPDADTVENCKRRVEKDADALILVIGGRYGSLLPVSEKSVTNVEYDVARAKRIPIFAFVKADVLALLAVWRDNPTADFRAAVDDPRVFQFISDIRGSHSIWMHEFTLARHITDGLRQQFAYRMMDGLALLRQLEGSPREYAGFSGQALRIALERPPGWNGLLLAQLVEDEIASAADLRIAYDAGVSFGPGDRVSETEILEWKAAVVNQALRLAEGLGRLWADVLNQALLAKDAGRTASCARIMSRGYRDAMEWAVRLRRTHVPEDWRPVVREMSLFTRDIIEQLERFPETLRQRLAEANIDLPSSEGTQYVDITVKLTVYNVEGFNNAMTELARKRSV